MMTATACPPNHHLRSLSLGELSEEDSQGIFEHLRSCEKCRAEMETLETTHDSLIHQLRTSDLPLAYGAEPNCRLAVAKALGALASDHGGLGGTEPLPESIGEYEIVRPLGSGGMGNVFLARHTKLRREVAVKLLASHRLSDARMRERFEAEMRAVGRLSHPNIVTAHDARDVAGTAVLVTEFIDGFDLGRLLHRVGPLSVADACEIVRQVAVALEYIAGQGFVHRDIKPSNIMLSCTGEVKLLDLGLARLQYGDEAQAEITGTGQAMGTADYVAPEQVNDSRNVDIRADIYSLGCTLFKLLTGHAPYSDARYTTAFAKMTAHVSATPPSLAEFLPTAPAGLVRLVINMLAKSPEQRPQTPMQVAQKLASFARRSNLRQLAQAASDAEPLPAASRHVRASSAARQRRTKPLLQRSVSVATLIATATAALLVGLCMGVIIKIKFPDGSEMIAQGPDGTQVVVEQTPTEQGSGDAAVIEEEEIELDKPSVGDSTNRFSPLSFAVLVPETDVDTMKQVKSSLVGNKTGEIVATSIGIWYPVADGVQVPMETLHEGQRYSLVKQDRDGRVSWEQINGHIQTINTSSGGGVGGGGTHIDLHFDDALATHMTRVTASNLNQQLAIIFNNRIVAAPTIRSPLGKSATISGKFTRAELRYLDQVLFGGLVEPLPVQATSPETDSTASADSAQRSHPLLEGMRIRSGQLTQAAVTREKLQRIGLAFHNFHDAYGKFPGSVNHREGGLSVGKDKQTFPFSWRVALLPFLGENALFEAYRFDQPWDSDENLKLLDKMPEVYHSLNENSQDRKDGHTFFVGIVGEHTALGSGDGQQLREFTDGMTNTLLILQGTRSIPWTQPEDAESAEIEALAKEPGIFYLTADGAPHTMSPIDWERLQKLITRDGGKVTN